MILGLYPMVVRLQWLCRKTIWRLCGTACSEIWLRKRRALLTSWSDRSPETMFWGSWLWFLTYRLGWSLYCMVKMIVKEMYSYQKIKTTGNVLKKSFTFLRQWVWITQFGFFVSFVLQLEKDGNLGPMGQHVDDVLRWTEDQAEFLAQWESLLLIIFDESYYENDLKHQ